MKVSVCVPTYNHEKYIARMLDGALMQQTTFSYEIVIGDDGSTDKAPGIIQEYARRYPERIRAYLHPHNLGPQEPREFGGRNNVLFLLKACRGEYVALCEGDDYWTDPHKLQKQVEFMDTHPDYALCHHNVRVIYEDGSPEHFFNPPDQKLTSTVEDLLEDRWFVATASLLYRNYFRTDPFADWHHQAAAGDWALVIQLAARGNIGYLPDDMGVYRKHRGGLSNIHAATNPYFLQNRKQMFLNVNRWLGGRYEKTVTATVGRYEQQLRELKQ
ncbi:glycosyltransferase family 2 protein [Telluribacter sp.]|jgi:glycosyltransferase involved in cell wall biosynthesis|uniref:glycosyltransferase family 2 protein n=1 Tax=Telluribacter sp. TaxID=1978767 RepID=UPI002E0E4C86|nr:glycosyltransferase [Telluribacter sp.]